MANANEFELHAPRGANKKPKRVGRGSSSGLGSTAGKGNKGQQSRSGSAVPYVGFEGGQMPLFRRIAHRGFSNAPFKKVFACVNLCDLEAKYADGETVNRESLKAKGLIGKVVDGVKVLGNGQSTKKLSLKVENISSSAKEKVENAVGSVKIIEKAAKESK